MLNRYTVKSRIVGSNPILSASSILVDQTFARRTKAFSPTTIKTRAPKARGGFESHPLRQFDPVDQTFARARQSKLQSD